MVISSWLESLRYHLTSRIHRNCRTTRPGIRRSRRNRSVQSIEVLEDRSLLSAAPIFSPDTYTFNNIAEDSAIGALVGTVTASDADDDFLSYSISAGDPAGHFYIEPVGSNGEEGEIKVTGPLDFETTATYTLTVEASDGFLTDTATVTINLTDVAEAPVFSPDTYTFSVAENAAFGTLVGAVAASDPEGDLLAFAIIAGNPGGEFFIPVTTGEIKVNGGLDFETTSSYTLTVQVTANSQSDTATVTINVTDVNDPPTITQVADQDDIEGKTISLQITASDTDNTLAELTFSAAGLPTGLSISTTGLVSGKIDFSAFADAPPNGTYNTLVTVTDPGAAAASMWFVWEIENAAIGSLTGTEYHGTSQALPNKITVTGVTSSPIYVWPDDAPPHFVELSISGAALPPDWSDVRFSVTAGATPATGEFGTDPRPLIHPGWAGSLHMVKAGIDTDGDGFLDGDEETHSFRIIVIDWDHPSTKILAQRTEPVELEESLFPIKSGEMFEVGSTFRFKLDGLYVGDPSMVRWELWDKDNTDELIDTDRAASFEYSFSSTALELGSTRVRFYIDRDDNEDFDIIFEKQMWSSTFEVVNLNTVNFTYDISSKLTAANKPFEDKTLTEITEQVQDAADTSIKWVRVKHSATDYRAAVALNLTPLGTGIFDATVLPDPVAEADEATHWSDMPDNHIRFVLVEEEGNGVAEPVGLFSVGDEMIVEWGVQSTTIVHELGHILLNDRGHESDNKNIMFGETISGISVELTLSQAQKFSGL